METPSEVGFFSVLVPLVIVVFIIAIGVFLLNQHFQRNLYRQRFEQEELKNQHQQELLKSSIKIQETERKRIARDLHDELGATLSIARMHLVRLEETAGAKTDVASLKNIRSITETALASMRKISHELMPPLLERFGLIKTLQEIVDQFIAVGELQVGLKAEQDFARMPWEVELALYRISMELLQNTSKHAGASKAEIFLTLKNQGEVILAYQDNGKGMDKKPVLLGLGLKSMEARANALGGTFELKKGKGFAARIVVPFEHHKDDE